MKHFNDFWCESARRGTPEFYPEQQREWDKRLNISKGLIRSTLNSLFKELSNTGDFRVSKLAGIAHDIMEKKIINPITVTFRPSMAPISSPTVTDIFSKQGKKWVSRPVQRESGGPPDAILYEKALQKVKSHYITGLLEKLPINMAQNYGLRNPDGIKTHNTGVTALTHKIQEKLLIFLRNLRFGT